jgi:hypothetical protein
MKLTILCLSTLAIVGCRGPLGRCAPAHPPAREAEHRAEPAAKPAVESVNPAAYEGPILVCDEPIHDFGEVWQGDELTHTFLVRNASPYRVEARLIVAGATTRPPDMHWFEPGETLPFTHTLNSWKVYGRFSKSLSLVVDRLHPIPDSE